ncbi:MAG TPA: NapC/NirT family cytochrome c [Vicinamibacterales bacterium]|nr:NapC/NirT family cytochrome c [Vicinamibacterales bacterium]
MADDVEVRQGLYRNGMSLAGAVIVTTAAVLFLTIFLLDLLGFHTNPYVGIVFFIVIPALFLLGLLIIPIGMILERRRRRRGDRRHYEWPRIDLNRPTHRRTALAVLSLTLANMIIVSLAAFRGVELMDSVEFCGLVCHEVMEPEYAAYEDGPHSRVLCVQCHIGPGAPWFVRSKLSGTRQVFAVLFDTHSRPIASPVENLRPARDTCEQCHWPDKFHGDKVNVIREYANDEAVTETVTTLRVHVGGGSERIGVATGIHWHMSLANEVEYISTDGRRQVIPYVRLRTRDGEVREYFDESVTPEELATGERRRMDCVDCHNRPSHPFSASPERAVDRAIAAGAIPRTLPYVRREAVEALRVGYSSREAAEEEIATRLIGFYRNGPTDLYAARREDVDRAVHATQLLYRRNVFPRMKVEWGTHPNNVGHIDSPGCFRCHDDTKKTKDGAVISQDCSLCHTIE